MNDVLGQVLSDPAAESEALDRLVAGLDDAGWRTTTPAAGWDVAAQVAHLAWSDLAARAAATDKVAWDSIVLSAMGDPDGFVQEVALVDSRDPRLLEVWRECRQAPGAHHRGVALHGTCPLRTRPRDGVRQGARGVRRADRLPPGSRPPARAEQDRDRARPADDAEGRRALRPGNDVGAGETANMAKCAAAEAACDAADRAVPAHRGHGISTEYGAAGLLVAARAGRIAPVSREMILNYVGMHSLGLPKSY